MILLRSMPFCADTVFRLGCFLRDRFLALAMGRPLRINTKDCDTPMPVAHDVTNDLDELPPAIRKKFMPPDFSQLADCWVVLLHLSKTLGTILSENYIPSVASGLSPTRIWIEETEQELMRGIAQIAERPADASPALAFYLYHLRLHFK